MNGLSLSAWEHNTKESYRYLLVDPLCLLHSSDPFHLDNLVERFSAQRVIPVLRKDLAYQIKYCPHLIELAPPGKDCDDVLLSQSLTQAYRERFNRKRAICGWLDSKCPIEAVAQHIGELCSVIGNELNIGYVLPFFEPLRFELLLLANQASVEWFSAQLSFIDSWTILIPGGGLLTEKGDKLDSQECYLSLKAKRAQKSLSLILGLLLAWQRILSKENIPLPIDATSQVLEKIITAEDLGLKDEQDIYYFGLTELTK